MHNLQQTGLLSRPAGGLSLRPQQAVVGINNIRRFLCSITQVGTHAGYD